jgi:hypothetical protein
MEPGDGERIMKREPQIFTRTNVQDVPVGANILDILTQEELAESLVRKCVEELLIEATWGEEWLSPEVVRFLINTYAEKSPVLGHLTWEYGKLPDRTWGKYVHQPRKLYVNKAKTKNMFKQQISTILHEIQHWNQHVKCSLGERSPAARSQYSDDPAAAATHDFSVMCNRNKWEHGYWKSPHEIDARQFAADNLQDALSKAGKFVSGKINVEDADEAWDDILDELTEYDVITHVMIGKELRDYDMNTPENMQLAVQKLKELGVEVR